MLNFSPLGGGEIPALAWNGFEAFREVIGRASSAALTLQSAARAFVDAFVARAPSSTVLARVYVTCPYRDLPGDEHAFADRLARAAGTRRRLRPDTPVLTMLASRGDRPEWNEPRRSQNHLAVPLTDAAFVRSIPMIASMLEDLGMPLDSLGDARGTGRARVGDTGTGVFHVLDASLPPRGSDLVPARDFVAEHAVRSVFGLGSTYLNGSVLAVTIFSRDVLEREVVLRLAPLAAAMKTKTYGVVSAGRIFDDTLH